MINFGNFKRNIIVASLSTLATTAMVYTFVKAEDNTLAENTQPQGTTDQQITSTDKESTTTQEVDTQSSGNQQLTSDEIEKIMEDLKVSTNLDNVLQKLDDIIKRAELSGNDALKDYAQNTKSKYELQKQLDTLNGLISAMKKKNGDIKALDDELNSVLSVNTILEDLQGALSDEALISLETLDEDKIGNLQEIFAEIEGLVDLNNIESFSVKQRALLDVLMLDEALNQGMFSGHRLDVARDALSVAVTLLKSYEKQKYGSSEYDALVSGSDQFASRGKKTKGVFPEQVVLFDGNFNLKHAPLMYDSNILLAIDDIYQYIDAKVDYMYNNATIVIQSPGNTVEITAGKNVAYVNDEPKNMTVSVMNVNDIIYVPAEFFAQTYGISYRYIPELQTIIFYKNLNQLSNPSVPNEINND